MSIGRILRLVALGLGGLTAVMTIICVVNVVRTRAFLADSVVATGQVVELISRQSCEDDEDDAGLRTCTTLYAPRVVFTAADGRTIDFVSDTASSPPDYAEGDVVDVRYPPARPAQAQVDSVMGIWLGVIVTGFIALVLAAICAVWVVLAVKFRRE